ncbi:hypothetical protein V6N13_089873 [Hibiscus sabdariffa]|uniref:Uncharacterized protein n=1 Tax=Hibiscus sabdariffa TaxID=183260 RepID=A0ABR2QII3_9ROSI
MVNRVEGCVVIKDEGAGGLTHGGCVGGSDGGHYFDRGVCSNGDDEWQRELDEGSVKVRVMMGVRIGW